MDKTILSPTEYRLLIEHSPVMVWRAGLDANCDYFNETWLAFTGRTLEQEAGNGWAEGVHPDDLDRCVTYYLDHFHRQAAFEMEYRLRRHDGEYRWIFDRGVPYNDDSGVFAGYIGSCVDVDERYRAQEREQLHNSEQLSLARDFEKWILAIVGHDIRDPLQLIQLAAFSMEKVAEPTGQAARCSGMVLRGVKRINGIVGDLLDLSRVREGAGLSLQPTSLDMRSLCQQIIDELEALVRDRKVTFDCEIDGNGAWDEPRVLQAISNLTSNAAQHAVPGTPIDIRLTGSATQVAVEVHNSGVIPLDLLPHIFEPFRAGHRAGVRGSGLGLGLFIARAIANAHGGALEVDSGDGST
ncbi:MAG: PAS domain-containing sensor histidine kinase, partial [Pseudomonadota bacterium]